MTTAPIVLFVYNRPWHVRKTVEALQVNHLAKESDLIIFSDGAKNGNDQEAVNQVRLFIRGIGSFRRVEIIESPVNKGLSSSIVSGVTSVIAQYGKIIVLEDDMLTSRFFLLYMNDALDLYEDDERVISVHAYWYPVQDKLPGTFFLRGADCWGWGTWRRGWDLFNPDGKFLLDEILRHRLEIEFDLNGSYPYTAMLWDNVVGKKDSWAIRWYASAFLKNKLTLNPGESLVQNVGTDFSGTHCKSTRQFQVNLFNQRVSVTKTAVEESFYAKKSLENFYRSLEGTRPSAFSRWLMRKWIRFSSRRRKFCEE
jgi:hypothetical protein